MNITNTYTYLLTGTSFGFLSSYSDVLYFNGFLFKDVFGNENFLRVLSCVGGNIIDPLTDSDIDNIDGLQLWLDASYLPNLKLEEEKYFVEIKDRKNNNIFYTISSDAFTQPITSIWYKGEVTSSKYPFISSLQDNFKTCLNFFGKSFMSSFTYKLDMSKPFTIYYLWVDKNDGEFGDTVPFTFSTFFETATGVYTLNIDYINEPAIILGNIDANLGIKVDSLSALSSQFDFYKPNLLKIEYDGSYIASLSNQDLFTNRKQISASSEYFLGGDPLFVTINELSGFTTTISFSGDGIFSNFIFCEELIFDKLLEKEEDTIVNNYLYTKWQLRPLLEIYNFNKSMSAEPLSNLVYDDVSLLTSNFQLPIQSCITNLLVVLSSFDQTVSPVNKVIYQYKDIVEDFFVQNSILPNISVTIIPESEGHLNSYNVSLSFVRFDGTVNKVLLNGEILKCGVTDVFFNNYLIDSQISSDINKKILIIENNDNKQVTLNTLDTFKNLQILSGGDVDTLKNTELISFTEDLLLLSDLLDDTLETEISINQDKFITPTPVTYLNPIKPLNN